MKYNIIQRVNKSPLITIIFFALYISSCGQDLQRSKYGIYFIQSVESYRKTVSADSLKKMTDLQSSIPGIVLDLRYAGKNNFMRMAMYPEGTHHTFLRLAAARALDSVQQELKARGLGLKIFDAYRPYSVTEKFWELVHDDRYVADPGKGSGHNRGIAVDLTVIELKTGKELVMPTGFDSFSDTAHQDFMNLPEKILENRKLLKVTMEKYGFRAFATEWWHYSLPNPEKYEVLDLSFEDLAK